MVEDKVWRANVHLAINSQVQAGMLLVLKEFVRNWYKVCSIWSKFYLERRMEGVCTNWRPTGGAYRFPVNLLILWFLFVLIWFGWNSKHFPLTMIVSPKSDVKDLEVLAINQNSVHACHINLKTICSWNDLLILNLCVVFSTYMWYLPCER